MALNSRSSAARTSGLNRLRQGLFAVVCAIALFCLYKLATSQQAAAQAASGELVLSPDSGSGAPINNISSLTGFLFDYFGAVTYLMPFALIFIGGVVCFSRMSLRNIDFFKIGLSFLGFDCLILGLTALFAAVRRGAGAGGVLGDFLVIMLQGIMPLSLITALAAALSLAGFFMFTGRTPFDYIKMFRRRPPAASKSAAVRPEAADKTRTEIEPSFGRGITPINPMASIKPIPDPQPERMPSFNTDPGAFAAPREDRIRPADFKSHADEHLNKRTEPSFGFSPSPTQAEPSTIISTRDGVSPLPPVRPERSQSTIITHRDDNLAAAAGSQPAAWSAAAQDEMPPADDQEVHTVINTGRPAFSQPEPELPAVPQPPAEDDNEVHTVITTGRPPLPPQNSMQNSAQDQDDHEVHTIISTGSRVENTERSADNLSLDQSESWNHDDVGSTVITAADNSVHADLSALREHHADDDLNLETSLPPNESAADSTVGNEETQVADAQGNIINFFAFQKQQREHQAVEVGGQELTSAFVPAAEVPPAEPASPVSEQDMHDLYSAASRGIQPEMKIDPTVLNKPALPADTSISTDNQVSDHNVYPEPESDPMTAPASAPIDKIPSLPPDQSNVTATLHADDGFRPSVDLLTPSPAHVQVDTDEIIKKAGDIDKTLRSYNIKAHVKRYCTGPVITRYDLELEPGLRSSEISNLSTDLCRYLMVPSVRVLNVVPGTQYVGLEIPNEKRQLITLYDMASTGDFADSKAALPMCIGCTVTGHPIIVDLATAPHLLIAGTTGSGKSAGLNTMLISLLLKLSPKQLRFILIDPKRIEFSPYHDLPHLITPVISDVAEKTSAALMWCIEEMERRYQLIEKLNVRKLSEYNHKIAEAEAQGGHIYDPTWLPEMGGSQPILHELPALVIVVEEFADLMAQTQGRKRNPNSPEACINRLAAKARAAGMHIILATQSPRTEVVTGVIKSNMPSRIAFTVQSSIDSRVILDEVGAEKLLGNGDMICKFMGFEHGQTFRAHGAYVSNEDVERVTSAWREHWGAPDYVEGVTERESEEEDEGSSMREGNDRALDQKFDEIAAYARTYYEKEHKYPSISAIQASFGVGYPRAKRIRVQLVREGVIDDDS